MFKSKRGRLTASLGKRLGVTSALPLSGTSPVTPDAEMIGRFFFIGLTAPVFFFVLGRVARTVLPF